MNPKYVSQVLNRDAESPKAEKKLRLALERLLTGRSQSDIQGKEQL